MSFTSDEIQSFNAILEQKLTQQRRELERSFDSRLQVFKREIEQRLSYTQKELTRTLSQSLSEHYRQIKGIMNASVATPTPNLDEATIDLSQLELHTELPLDELAEAVNQTLDERFSALNDTLKAAIAMLEQQFVARIQALQEVRIVQSQPLNGTVANTQDIIASIEQLEDLIESMQVAMTSNTALLSNRLYHHQQLPLERAHPVGQDGTSQGVNNTAKQQLPLPRE